MPHKGAEAGDMEAKLAELTKEIDMATANERLVR